MVFFIIPVKKIIILKIKTVFFFFLNITGVVSLLKIVLKTRIHYYYVFLIMSTIVPHCTISVQ